MISPQYRNSEFDPAGEYTVSYMWGTVGIIYNSAMIEEEITSWSSMFDPRYTGQILMIDNPRDAFGIALKFLGHSLNTTSEDELRAAFAVLDVQKPMLQAYVMDTIFDKLEGGEAAIGAYYAGDYITMRDKNPDLRFVLPVEGSNYFADAMCVPKGAANKENAEKFMNFITSTESCLKNMDITGYVSANAEAAAEYGANLDDEDYDILFPDESILNKCEPFINLPLNTLELYDSLWAELKS
jgi:spermidine/putrescine transport system substrate-binding protein